MDYITYQTDLIEDALQVFKSPKPIEDAANTGHQEYKLNVGYDKETNTKQSLF
jgi:hypothetical protein